MRILTLTLFAFFLFGSGCVQYHYSPNFIQTPYLDNKGDATVSAAVSGSPQSLNGDFHVSYSPVKHGSVMLNFYKTRTRFEDSNFFGAPSYLQSARGYLLEGAVGGYWPIGFGVGSLYVGGGRGAMRNDYGIGRVAELGLQRFFVQPAFTFKNDWFRIGMGVRFVMLSFPTGNVDYRIEPDDIQVIEGLENDSPFFFPELGGNIGIHFKPITITANMVIVASQNVGNYGFDGSNIGIGMALELDELGKKGAKKTRKNKRK